MNNYILHIQYYIIYYVSRGGGIICGVYDNGWKKNIVSHIKSIMLWIMTLYGLQLIMYNPLIAIQYFHYEM